jgi:translation initiation factor IF-3
LQTLLPHGILKNIKRVKINNQIKSTELRVIDNDGKNLGVFKLEEALETAKEKNLDLIEISPNAKPPIAKIMDFGKFQYQNQKKAKTASEKTHETETKVIQINIGTSLHDLELKAKKISEFLKEKHRVKISLVLRGRAKYLEKDFINERLKRIFPLITENYKIAEDTKKGPAGISIIIEHA